MTKTFTKGLFAIIALAILSAASAFAQSTVSGGITGRVADPQGASVTGATVTVTNIGTNATTSTTTSDDGAFRVPNLQPGRYRVETAATGFSKGTAEVVVEVGTVTTANFDLTVGGATGEVTVTADAPVVNTTDNTNATNINETSLSELPINGRRAVNFVLLTPATVPDGTFGLVSFRGVSGVLNNSQVDGGDNNQAWQSEERGRTRIGYVVSQSAIREFQVNTSNYSAEYGRSAGGVINTVTKSGTNEFHGQVFEYYRDNQFGARNPRAFRSILNPDLTVSTVGYKPEDVRHQFGANVCGPIVKNNLFFCFTYDQQKRNFPGLAVFSNLNYLNTVNRTLLLSRGITTPQIDSTLEFLNSLTGETPRRGDQTLIFPKIDWNINQNHLFTASYNRLRWESPAGLQTQATNTNARHSFGDDYVDVDTLNLRLQSTFATNVLNEARFQWSSELGRALSQPPLPGEPATATTSQGARSPSVFLTGGLTFGTTNNFERNAYPDEKRWQIADAVTWTTGKHTVKFGGEFSHVTDIISNLRTETGSYSYGDINNFIVDYVRWQNPTAPITNCATTGTGRIPGRCWTSNYAQGVGIDGLDLSVNEYAFFAQDDIRFSPKFTLNLGLRWEYQSMPDPILANTSTAIIPNDGRTLNDATSTLPDDKNNFGPRVGFAYDIFGDGKTSFRGGFGIYYGRLMTAQIFNAMINTGNPGGQGQVTVPVTAANAPLFPALIPSNSLSLGLAAIQFFQKDFQAPMIYQYDAILEHQIAKNTVVSISWVGSTGRNLPTFFDQNLIATGTTTTYTVVGGPFDGTVFGLPQYTRANTSFQQLTRIQSTVTSQYDALVFQFNRRFTDGLQIQSSYTFAKSTDTGQNSAIFPVNNSPYDPKDRSYDLGPSANDVRHKVVASVVYSPTWYKGDSGSFYHYLLNGWTFAPIAAYYSGKPYDGTVSGTSLNNSNGDNRFPLNPRNYYRLPSLFNLDMRVSKRFAFSERYSLEFLAEAFNVFNSTHVFSESSVLYSRGTGTNSGVLTYQTTFGDINGTDSFNYRERQIQFGVRFNF